MSSRFSLLTLIGALAATASPLLAQDSETGLRTRIEQELFTFGDCGAPLCLDLDNTHGDHFVPSLGEGNDAVILFLSQAIGNAPSSVPLGATSSGATFSIVGGLPVRTSTSAGPIFNERTQTLGRGRIFFGASITGVDYTSINGTPLDGIRLNFQHENGDPTDLGDPEFENDIMALDLALNVNVIVAAAALTVGLTDFIDLGIAVPFVRTEVSGRSDAQFLPFGNSAIHRFGGESTDPILRATTSLEGKASGIGDIAGRLKINLGQGSTMGAGLLAELRLPTGDEENLLGAGASQFRVAALYSAQLGNFSPHLNLGYVGRNGDSQRDGVNIQVAFDQLVTEWATIAAGVEGELQMGDNPFVLPEDVTFDSPFLRSLPATNIPNRDGDLMRAMIGGKFTVRGGTVLVANGIFPLRSVGLQPDFIWTLGLDFPF